MRAWHSELAPPQEVERMGTMSRWSNLSKAVPLTRSKGVAHHETVKLSSPTTAMLISMTTPPTKKA